MQHVVVDAPLMPVSVRIPLLCSFILPHVCCECLAIHSSGSSAQTSESTAEVQISRLLYWVPSITDQSDCSHRTRLWPFLFAHSICSATSHRKCQDTPRAVDAQQCPILTIRARDLQNAKDVRVSRLLFVSIRL